MTAAARRPEQQQRQQQQQQQAAQEQRPSSSTPLQERLAGAFKAAAKAAAVLGVAVALVLGRCDAAHAARSAGRAGGFSSPPAASRGYSSGGGGGGLRGGGLRGGYSGGVYSSPYSSYRSPVLVPSPPIYVPGPPLIAPMVPAPVVVGPRAAVVTAGPNIVDVALVSVFVLMAASAASSMLRDAGDGLGSALGGGDRPTLVRVQVGLLSLARGFKADLERIAARADTSGPRGLQHLLQEVALALLRNPSYCAYGAASTRSCGSLEGLEAAFSSASLEERSKFEQETLVNAVGGGGARRSAYVPRGGAAAPSKPDELCVVTLLVAATGPVPGLPRRLDTLADLQAALRALGAVPAEQVAGVELLWTPQDPSDFYTRDDIITDYPHLKQL